MWDDAKALTALAATLSAMAAMALLAAGVHWLARQPAFAIREVVVTTPLLRASAPHLETIVRDELAGTFFTMNLERARAAIGKRAVGARALRCAVIGRRVSRSRSRNTRRSPATATGCW